MKVVNLTAWKEHQSATVNLLKDLLKEAKAQNIDSIAVVVTTKDGYGDVGKGDGSQLATFVSHTIDNFYETVGALEELKFALMERGDQ